MFAPKAVSALHKTEYTQTINIVSQRNTMGLNKSLNGLDMGPGALAGEEVSKKDFPAVIIDGNDQGPFFLSTTGPTVG